MQTVLCPEVVREVIHVMQAEYEQEWHDAIQMRIVAWHAYRRMCERLPLLPELQQLVFRAVIDTTVSDEWVDRALETKHEAELKQRLFDLARGIF